MKKYILILFLSIFTISTFAQGVRMGLSASPQLSWLKSNNGEVKSDGVRMGFNFGMNTDFFFAERYSFSTGVFINNTGGKLKYNDSLIFNSNGKIYNLAPEAVITYKIQYIDIPMDFRMESNQIGYFVFYAQFGVTNHLRVGASADVNSSNTELNGSGCKDEVAFYTMSYDIGGGFNYYFSKNTAVTVGILYSNGFIDVTNNTDSNYSDNATLRNIALKIGILF